MGRSGGATFGLSARISIAASSILAASSLPTLSHALDFETPGARDILAFDEAFDSVPGSESCITVVADGVELDVTALTYEVFDDDTSVLVGEGRVWEGQFDLPPAIGGACVFPVGIFVDYAETYRIERSWRAGDGESLTRDLLVQSGVLIENGGSAGEPDDGDMLGDGSPAVGALLPPFTNETDVIDLELGITGIYPDQDCDTVFVGGRARPANELTIQAVNDSGRLIGEAPLILGEVPMKHGDRCGYPVLVAVDYSESYSLRFAAPDGTTEYEFGPFDRWELQAIGEIVPIDFAVQRAVAPGTVLLFVWHSNRFSAQCEGFRTSVIVHDQLGAIVGTATSPFVNEEYWSIGPRCQHRWIVEIGYADFYRLRLSTEDAMAGAVRSRSDLEEDRWVWSADLK